MKVGVLYLRVRRRLSGQIKGSRAHQQQQELPCTAAAAAAAAAEAAAELTNTCNLRSSLRPTLRIGRRGSA